MIIIIIKLISQFISKISNYNIYFDKLGYFTIIVILCSKNGKCNCDFESYVAPPHPWCAWTSDHIRFLLDRECIFQLNMSFEKAKQGTDYIFLAKLDSRAWW
jgi:hypothetical protein